MTYKLPDTIRYIVCLLCFISLLGGCKNDKPQQPVKPKVFSQKINVQPQKKTTTEKKTPAETQEVEKAPVKASQEKPVLLSAQVEEPSPAEEKYDPAGRTDPFIALISDKPVYTPVQKDKQIRRKPTTPLEKIDLSQLRLVGVIRAPSGNKAIVQEATGKGYIIQKGTYIGTHSGSVVKILKDRVIVEEQVEDLLGKLTIQEKELKLQKPTGDQ